MSRPWIPEDKIGGATGTGDSRNVLMLFWMFGSSLPRKSRDVPHSGSRSIVRTRRPRRAANSDSIIVVVDLPTPPLPNQMARRIGPAAGDFLRGIARRHYHRHGHRAKAVSSFVNGREP